MIRNRVMPAMLVGLVGLATACGGSANGEGPMGHSEGAVEAGQLVGANLDLDVRAPSRALDKALKAPRDLFPDVKPGPQPEPEPEPQPEPEPEPEPQPEPEPEPQPGTDRFGVSMIYPSKAGGEAWFLGDDPNRDSRFDPQSSLTRNGDGSWKMTKSQVRMHAMTSTGYNTNAIETYDRDELAAKGYMQAPNDWKNVEMTGFVKVNKSDGKDNFAWYARGGRHSDGIACEGSAYKGDLHYDGRFRVAKETWHVSYEHGDYGSKKIAPITGRWVGFKTIIRNVDAGGKPAVKVELWVNDNADQVTWEKVYEIVDDGVMGGDSGQCGASDPSMPLTWGGPLATFRWDTATDVDFKWLSVREVE